MIAMVLSSTVVDAGKKKKAKKSSAEEHFQPVEEIATDYPTAPPGEPAQKPRQVTKQNKLPDLGDPKARHGMACSVCRGVVGEVHQILNNLAKKGPKGRPREMDVAEAFDGICPRLAGEFSLMTLDNQMDFSEEEKKNHKGYYVRTFFENRCGALFDEREDDMVKYFREHPDQFLTRICTGCEFGKRYDPKEEEERLRKENEAAYADYERQRKEREARGEL